MNDNSKKPYVSVIKINGVPILPPLITPERRKELLKDKHQAMKLELRLKNYQKLKSEMNKLLEAQNKTAHPDSYFPFSSNSHVDALDIPYKPKSPRKLKNLHLSKDLIEVAEYNSIKDSQTIHSYDLKNDTENYASSDITLNIPNFRGEADHYRCRSASVPRIESKDNIKDSEPSTPPKPRLIRSNSYTLETPSPILLEHLHKMSQSDIQPNLTKVCNWVPDELNNSGLSSLNTVFYRDSADKSEATSSPDKSAKDISEVKSPTIEVYQTDISVQQITVNNVGANNRSNEEKREAFFTKNPFDVLEPDSELLNVLKDIPDTYANQIIQLLKKQHIEQKERLERYDNVNGATDNVFLNSDNSTIQNFSDNKQKFEKGCVTENQKMLENNAQATSQLQTMSLTTSLPNNLIDLSSLSDHDLVNSNINSRPITSESRHSNRKLRRSSTFSMSPSQSLYYSSTSDSEATNRLTPNVNLLELDSDRNGDNGDRLEIGILRDKNGYWEGIMMHENAKDVVGCSRELFPQIDPVTINAQKKERAASIIGAHVKGYLTRRLIKTDKVKVLISTVKDVLMCALELHQSENIDEKDVELHRRLINQLSAALYSFHDIFFDLPISEQMLIIAKDRQRKREKLMRPQSGRNSLRRSATSSRSEKSLTPVKSSRHKPLGEPRSLTKV